MLNPKLEAWSWDDRDNDNEKDDDNDNNYDGNIVAMNEAQWDE